MSMALRTLRREPRAYKHAERGVALVVALVLMVVATLIGLAGIRGTSLQERMSANLYDRSLAFQRAEAALRDAERAITANWRIADLGGVKAAFRAYRSVADITDEAQVDDGPFLFPKLVTPSGPRAPVSAADRLLDYEVELCWVTLQDLVPTFGERMTRPMPARRWST